MKNTTCGYGCDWDDPGWGTAVCKEHGTIAESKDTRTPADFIGIAPCRCGSTDLSFDQVDFSTGTIICNNCNECFDTKEQAVSHWNAYFVEGWVEYVDHYLRSDAGREAVRAASARSEKEAASMLSSMRVRPEDMYTPFKFR